MDKEFGFRLAGAVGANIIEYLMNGAQICTLTGAALGAGYGLVFGVAATMLGPGFPGILEALEIIPTICAYSSMVGCLLSLVLGLPVFFVAAFFAPPNEKRVIREGYLLWYLRSDFPRGQAMGSLCCGLAAFFVVLAVQLFSKMDRFFDTFWILIPIAVVLGAAVGGVGGAVRAINKSMAFQRLEYLRRAEAADAQASGM